MLYSLRMRAAQGGPHGGGGRHISGAERLLPEEALEAAAAEMLRRALCHPKGKPDFVNITVDAVPEESVLRVPLLSCEPDSLYEAGSVEAGRVHALSILTSAGVSTCAAEQAMRSLSEAKEAMRGAMLIDAESGARLDENDARGVRVSRMDAADEAAYAAWRTARNLRTDHAREALLLASKVASAPGIMAELCWSDDPDYVTGYAAAAGVYHRICPLKPSGDGRGGRVFFVRPGADLSSLTAYLERRAVLVVCG